MERSAHGRKLRLRPWKHCVGRTAAGHPQGRSEAKEPRSGLTRRRPSDTPRVSPSSDDHGTPWEIHVPIARNNPGDRSSHNLRNNSTATSRAISATTAGGASTTCPMIATTNARESAPRVVSGTSAPKPRHGRQAGGGRAGNHTAGGACLLRSSSLTAPGLAAYHHRASGRLRMRAPSRTVHWTRPGMSRLPRDGQHGMPTEGRVTSRCSSRPPAPARQCTATPSSRVQVHTCEEPPHDRVRARNPRSPREECPGSPWPSGGRRWPDWDCLARHPGHAARRRPPRQATGPAPHRGHDRPSRAHRPNLPPFEPHFTLAARRQPRPSADPPLGDIFRMCSIRRAVRSALARR